MAASRDISVRRQYFSDYIDWKKCQILLVHFVIVVWAFKILFPKAVGKNLQTTLVFSVTVFGVYEIVKEYFPKETEFKGKYLKIIIWNKKSANFWFTPVLWKSYNMHML